MCRYALVYILFMGYVEVAVDSRREVVCTLATKDYSSIVQFKQYIVIRRAQDPQVTGLIVLDSCETALKS